MSLQKAFVEMKKTLYLQLNIEDKELKNFDTPTFQIPSCIYISDLVRHFYRAMRSTLVEEMESHHCSSQYIALDHTFKMSTKIFSTEDERKKSQFNAMLIVMDKEGLILGFAFVRSQSLEDEVSKKLLKHINRYESVKMVAVDNCCIVRKKLTSILGSADRVVLDVFHALQRVTSEEKTCKNLTPARKEIFNRKVSKY